MNDSFISKCVVVLAHEYVSASELMKFTDSLAVVTDDEGCDAIRDGDKSMRAGERIDLKLLFKLSLLLRLLLEAPRCGLCRHGCDTHVLRWRGLLLL